MADDSKHQPPEGSPPTTKQGRSQLKTPAANLPMRAIQATEELAKVLKQFHPPTLGKNNFYPIPKIYPLSLLKIQAPSEQLPIPSPLSP